MLRFRGISVHQGYNVYLEPISFLVAWNCSKRDRLLRSLPRSLPTAGCVGTASTFPERRSPPPRIVDQAAEVTTASPPHCFEVSGSLLYLQPSAGDLEYGTLISPLPITSPNWSNQSLKPGFSPAFGVEMRYIADATNDIELNWTHLNTMTTASVVTSPTQMVGPPYLIGPESTPYSIGQGSARFDYDAISFDGGHTFCAECPFQMRVFVGVELARIGQEVSGLFLSTDGSDSSGYTNHSLFTGVWSASGSKRRVFVRCLPAHRRGRGRGLDRHVEESPRFHDQHASGEPQRSSDILAQFDASDSQHR